MSDMAHENLIQGVFAPFFVLWLCMLKQQQVPWWSGDEIWWVFHLYFRLFPPSLVSLVMVWVHPMDHGGSPGETEGFCLGTQKLGWAQGDYDDSSDRGRYRTIEEVLDVGYWRDWRYSIDFYSYLTHFKTYQQIILFHVCLFVFTIFQFSVWSDGHR